MIMQPGNSSFLYNQSFEVRLESRAAESIIQYHLDVLRPFQIPNIREVYFGTMTHGLIDELDEVVKSIRGRREWKLEQTVTGLLVKGTEVMRR